MTAKPERAIPFEDIERNWSLATWALSPAVGRRRDDASYYIRVVNTRPGSPRFGYFEVSADGTVLAAPRGVTKDYKPGRITGLDDAVVEKYKQIHREMHPRYAKAGAADSTSSRPPGATAFALPLLDRPCPDCTPEDAQKRKAAEYKAWSDEEQAAYEKFTAESTAQWGVAEDWMNSPIYRELKDREPEPAGVGCGECDCTQRVLTDAGRQLLAFMNTWGGK